MSIEFGAKRVLYSLAVLLLTSTTRAAYYFCERERQAHLLLFSWRRRRLRWAQHFQQHTMEQQRALTLNTCAPTTGKQASEQASHQWPTTCSRAHWAVSHDLGIDFESANSLRTLNFSANSHCCSIAAQQVGQLNKVVALSAHAQSYHFALEFNEAAADLLLVAFYTWSLKNKTNKTSSFFVRSFANSHQQFGQKMRIVLKKKKQRCATCSLFLLFLDASSLSSSFIKWIVSSLLACCANWFLFSLQHTAAKSEK